MFHVVYSSDILFIEQICKQTYERVIWDRKKDETKDKREKKQKVRSVKEREVWQVRRILPVIQDFGLDDWIPFITHSQHSHHIPQILKHFILKINSYRYF